MSLEHYQTRPINPVSFTEYTVVKVPVQRLNFVWKHAVPLLLIGMTVAPEMTMDDVIDGLADESVQLWLVTDGSQIAAAFLTSIERDKGEWVVSLYALGGSQARSWLGRCDEAMDEFARHEGAKRGRMCGRKAWSRLLPKSFAITGERHGHNVYERAVK